MPLQVARAAKRFVSRHAFPARTNMNCLICFFVFTLSRCFVDATPTAPSRRTADSATRMRTMILRASQWGISHANQAAVMPPPYFVLFGRQSHTRFQRKKYPQKTLTSFDAEIGRTSLMPLERLGLTLDRCIDDGDCLEPRICLGADLAGDGFSPCSFDAIDCRCLSQDLENDDDCVRDADCVEGEICVNLVIDGVVEDPGFCVSAEARPHLVGTFPVNESLAILSGEACLTSSQCNGDLQCQQASVLTDSLGPECALDDFCICRPSEEGYIVCNSDNDCAIDGEVCAFVRNDNTGEEKRVCASKALADGWEVYTHQGLTGDFCQVNRDCAGERECLNPDESSCTEKCICILRDAEECISSDDCNRPREICAQPVLAGNQQCVSVAGVKRSGFYGPPRGTTATQTPTPAFVCVDAKSLSHLQSSELVFPEHIPARVLCDEKGSCATAGHMVLFRGMPMRMSSYCRMVGCSRSVTLVNSPRLGKRVRIPTKTEGLLFTALAAKFDTHIEEVALRTALRLGLS